MTEQASIQDQLFSDNPREIKAALDYLSKHTHEAGAFKERISELRRYTELVDKTGVGAAQVEVGAIILYNQMTFVPGKK